MAGCHDGYGQVGVDAFTRSSVVGTAIMSMIEAIGGPNWWL